MKSKNLETNLKQHERIVSTFECSFCGKEFKREKSFLEHTCEQRTRHEAMRNDLTTKTAFRFYETWMRLQRRTVQNTTSFLKSKHFKAFVEFASFVKRVKLVDVEMYIRMMINKRIQPQYWISNKCFSMYLTYVDHKKTPMQHAKITINTLMNIAEAANCDVSEVFNVLTPQETVFLIQQRKLSLWVLLRSKKFKSMILTLDDDERETIEELLQPETWINKFQQHHAAAETMKKLVTELGI